MSEKRRIVADEVAPSDLSVGERIYAYREIQTIKALTELDDHGPLLQVTFEDQAFGHMHFRPDTIVLRVVNEVDGDALFQAQALARVPRSNNWQQRDPELIEAYLDALSALGIRFGP